MSKSYRELKNSLDELLAWFDQDDLDVDEAMKKYDEAQKVIAELEEYLSGVQEKVKKIKST